MGGHNQVGFCYDDGGSRYVHFWSDPYKPNVGVWLQNFKLIDGSGNIKRDSVLMLSADQQTAYWVKEGFWGAYKLVFGPANVGAPKSAEQQLSDGSIVQYFDKAKMVWDGAKVAVIYNDGGYTCFNATGQNSCYLWPQDKLGALTLKLVSDIDDNANGGGDDANNNNNTDNDSDDSNNNSVSDGFPQATIPCRYPWEMTSDEIKREQLGLIINGTDGICNHGFTAYWSDIPDAGICTGCNNGNSNGANNCVFTSTVRQLSSRASRFDAQISQAAGMAFSVIQGKTYALTFDARDVSDMRPESQKNTPRIIIAAITPTSVYDHYNPITDNLSQSAAKPVEIVISNVWKNYQTSFMAAKTINNAILKFFFGDLVGSLTLDNIKLVETPTTQTTLLGNIIYQENFESGSYGLIQLEDHGRGLYLSTNCESSMNQLGSRCSLMTKVPQSGLIYTAQLKFFPNLIQNHNYQLTFNAKNSINTSIAVEAGKDVSPYDNCGLYQRINLTPTWQEFKLTFTAKFTDANTKINWQFGETINTFYLDNIVLTDLTNNSTAPNQQQTNGQPTNNADSSSAPANLIKNFNFQNGTSNWNLEDHIGGAKWSIDQNNFYNNHSTLLINLPMTQYHYQEELFQLVPIVQGKNYQLKAALKSQSPRTVSFEIFKYASPYTSYGLWQTVNLTSNWQVCTATFQAKASDSEAKAAIHLGGSNIPVYAGEVSLTEIK